VHVERACGIGKVAVNGGAGRCRADPVGLVKRSGAGEAVLLWRDEHSEASLYVWWQPRTAGLRFR
jgi:hypothetical protein